MKTKVKKPSRTVSVAKTPNLDEYELRGKKQTIADLISRIEPKVTSDYEELASILPGMIKSLTPHQSYYLQLCYLDRVPLNVIALNMGKPVHDIELTIDRGVDALISAVAIRNSMINEKDESESEMTKLMETKKYDKRKLRADMRKLCQIIREKGDKTNILDCARAIRGFDLKMFPEAYELVEPGMRNKVRKVIEKASSNSLHTNLDQMRSTKITIKGVESTADDVEKCITYMNMHGMQYYLTTFMLLLKELVRDGKFADEA